MNELKVATQRYRSIDLIRGIVLVLMALDHTRDFLGSSSINPRNVADPLLFVTRWITHFCAPVFAFLAGASAWFILRRHGDIGKVSRYLLLRGIWLILLELTVVRFAWTFQPRPEFIILQVLWVLGWGMILLSLLVAWPPSVVGAIGAGMILSHNLLDPISAVNLGPADWIWSLLHEPHLFDFGHDNRVWVLYTLIPWIGVMAFGYGYGPNFVPQARRSRFFYVWGFSLIGLFMLLRFIGGYGDPLPWQSQPTFVKSLLEFVNCEKYPPSLQFLLMTIGPMLAIYPLIKDIDGAVPRILVTFGSVSMFFYVLHIPVIHILAVVLAALQHKSIAWAFDGFPLLQKPNGYGISLVGIYCTWLFILSILYPACRWYASEKLFNRQWWHRLI